MFQKFLSPHIFCYIIGSLWEINRYGFSLYLEHIYIYIFELLRVPVVTNQDFIICCRYFSCYLFVSLWHCSHMSLSYLSSDDGLIFFCFSFCGALGLLTCLKSKKQKGSDSLPCLMGSYHKFYLHVHLCQHFWVNG